MNPMETLAESIDDVLNLALPGVENFAEYLEGVEALREFAPDMVFLARSDGEVIFANDHGPGIDFGVAKRVAAEVADLRVGESAQFRMATNLGSRTTLAVRLSNGPAGLILACLFGSPDGAAGEHGECDAKTMLLGSLAWTAAKCRATHVESLARVEQLTAGQEALQESYSQSLENAVEEREERLREQEEHASRLQAVMMTAAEGIITVDASGRIESLNAAACEIFGYSPEEIIGHDVSRLFPQSQDTQPNDFFGCLSRGGTRNTTSQELLGKRNDGTIFPIELAISDVVLQDRRIITAILRDITDRKAAEQQLKRLHLFNKMILDSAGEGIVGIDRKGAVAFVNPAAEQMFGRTSTEMVGGSLHSLAHHSHANHEAYLSSECPVQMTLSEGAVQRVDREVFWRKDGTSFPVEYVATPMREDQEIIGAVLTFQDITQRQALECQLVQAQKLESIGQLAAGIAHEINTPTQFIGDNLRFLDEAFGDLRPHLQATICQPVTAGSPDTAGVPLPEPLGHLEKADLEYLAEEVPKAISQSLEGVERVAKIVRSMKEFSHPGGDEMQTVDLNRAIESTLTVCRNEWKYVADVITDLDPHLPSVTCLPGECNQVFLNLIINAAHAIAEANSETPGEKGTITVSTRTDGDWVAITIADTGTGIPEGARMKVFDPFFTTKQVGRGTGQGLAIARSVVVDKHGGNLSFETELGRGTSFLVRFPRSQSQSSARGTSHEEATSSD